MVQRAPGKGPGLVTNALRDYRRGYRNVFRSERLCGLGNLDSAPRLNPVSQDRSSHVSSPLHDSRALCIIQR
ncbi:hypothetical protein Plhal304r1_c032g0103211 [Plasmopara halstedii]